MEPVNKVTAVSATRINRCYAVHIDNPYHKEPTITFAEEEVIVVEGGQSVLHNIGRQITVPADFARSIPLRNPQTTELTGTSVTGADLYVILYSLFWQLSDEELAAAAQKELDRIEAEKKAAEEEAALEKQQQEAEAEAMLLK